MQIVSKERTISVPVVISANPKIHTHIQRPALFLMCELPFSNIHLRHKNLKEKRNEQKTKNFGKETTQLPGKNKDGKANRLAKRGLKRRAESRRP